MSDAFATLVSRTREWFERAHADGWLSDGDLQRFTSFEQRTPADLFADTQRRPLVIAFFGGTGVGKSSLLNRLAGEAIARTGVERPTSREITVYLHESVELATLPPELPVEPVHLRRHGVDARRDALWIDAPDIDSAHEDNRRLALAWLPHIDLLVYVVSPERYRDDVGWRVLRQRGEKHGWMFVLNRWDEGDASQKEDFARMLREAGFSDPLLLCTSCVETAGPLPTPDEFDRIEAAIGMLLAEHGVRELERLGHRARLLEMREALNRARERLGDDEQWESINAARATHWLRTQTALRQGLEWPIRAIASRFAIRERGLLGRVVWQAVAAARAGPSARIGIQRASRSKARGSDATADPSHDALGLDTIALTQSLWDDWTQDKLAECLDAVEVKVRRAGIAATPVRARLDAAAERAGRLVLQSVRDRVRAALSRPGTRLQRALRRVTGFLMATLPLLALLWVAYNVVEGYFRASTGGSSYLGTDFAVNSVLLLLVAWAVPFAFDRLLRPSLERTALHAMREGLADGLDEVGEQLRAAVSEAASQARSASAAANRMVGEISRLALQPVGAAKATLSRLLMTPSRGPAPVGG
jgi:hypothetical protein